MWFDKFQWTLTFKKTTVGKKKTPTAHLATYSHPPLQKLWPPSKGIEGYNK